MKDILKALAAVFVFLVGGVFALVGIVFSGIEWVLGSCGELLCGAAVDMIKPDNVEQVEENSEEVPT